MVGLVASLLGRMSQLLLPGDRRFLSKRMVSDKLSCKLCLAVSFSCWYLLGMQVIPPYNGFGILEDSLQNCFSLLPKPPRKDIIKMLENNHKVLRYQVALVSAFLDGIVPAYVVESEGWEEQPAQTRLLANSSLCRWEKRVPQANASVPQGMPLGYCVLAVTISSTQR